MSCSHLVNFLLGSNFFMSLSKNMDFLRRSVRRRFAEDWLRTLLRDTEGLKAQYRFKFNSDKNPQSVEGVWYFKSEDQLREALRENEVASLSLPRGYYDHRISAINDELGCSHFDSLQLDSDTKPWEIARISVKTAHIRGSGLLFDGVRCAQLTLVDVRGSTEIKDCEIGELIISFSSNQSDMTFAISNCFIGSMNFSNEPKVKDFFIKNSEFWRESYSPDQLKLFSSIDPFSPRANRATFSALLNFSRRVGNSETASIARCEELAQDKIHATGLNWLILTMWESLSDFGGSAGKPIAWFVLSWVICFSVLLNTGVALSFGDSNLVGWQTVMDRSSGPYSEVFRALAASFEFLMNPLSSISGRSIFVPDSLLGLIVKLFHGYFSILCFFLAAFSLRRRFRSYE